EREEFVALSLSGRDFSRAHAPCRVCGVKHTVADGRIADVDAQLRRCGIDLTEALEPRGDGCRSVLLVLRRLLDEGQCAIPFPGVGIVHSLQYLGAGLRGCLRSRVCSCGE